MNASPYMAGKNAKPPPLPIETFERVVRVSRLDGKMLAIIATTFAVMAALSHNAPPAIAGVIAAGLGLLEMNGSDRLQNGDPKGLDAMIMAQVGLLATVFTYAGWMLLNFDPTAFVNHLPPSEREIFEESLRLTLDEGGYADVDLPTVYRGFNTLVYLVVAAVTLVFQGMMIRFYHRSRSAIEKVVYGG